MNVHSISLGDRFSALCVAAEGRSLLVAAESDSRPNDEPRALSHVLAAAVRAEGELNDDGPRRIAEEMDRLLRATPESERSPRWAFFVAVLLTPTSIQYSLAGSFRVHLLKNDRVIRVSDDQTVARDSGADVRFPPGFEDLAGDVALSNVASRALGCASLAGGHELPPVTSVWSETLPYEVAVCSDGVHQQKEPQTYCDVFRDFSSSGRVPPKHKDDLIAIVAASA